VAYIATKTRTSCPSRVLCHDYRRSKRRCATIREMIKCHSQFRINSDQMLHFGNHAASCGRIRHFGRPSDAVQPEPNKSRALAAATSDFSALVTLAPPNLFNPNGHIDQTLACSSSTSPNRTARYRRCSGLGRGRRVSSSKNDLSFTPRALPMCHSATTVGVRWPNSRPVT
jgi:hypothetical protein